jgi:hypothetical protein
VEELTSQSTDDIQESINSALMKVNNFISTPSSTIKTTKI